MTNVTENATEPDFQDDGVEADTSDVELERERRQRRALVMGAAVIIGGTILAVVVATWLRRRSIAPVFAETLMTGGWLIAFVASMPYTALKGWPARTQAVFMALLMTVVGTLMIGGIWINRG